MPMPEAVRQEYLESMGIQSYFPRFQLAGARASVLCELREDVRQAAAEAQPSGPSEKEATTAKNLAVKSARAASGSSATENAIPKSAAATTSHTGSKSAAISSSSKAAAAEQLRFRLAFIHVGAGFSALVQLPHADRVQGLSPAAMRLFTNICRALRQDAGAASVDPLLFRWPFSEAAHLDRSPAAAAKALQAYVAEKLQQQGKGVLLVMGSQLAELLPPDSSPVLVKTRSLQEMLSMPRFKREAWTALRTLRGQQ